jgi:drug/metabolite transporter (DMT)-like permease
MALTSRLAGVRALAGAKQRATSSLTVAIFLVVLPTVAIWASIHPIGKIAMTDVGASHFAAARVGYGCIFLLLLCLATGRVSELAATFQRSRVGWVALLGICGFFFSSVFTMTALSLLPAGVSSVISNASPLIVAVIMPLVGQAIGVRTVLGIVIGFGGVALIAVRGGTDGAGVDPLGVLLSMIGTVGWAVYLMIARRAAAGLDTVAVGATAIMFGALPTIGWMLVWDGPRALLEAQPGTHLLLIWSGAAGTGLAFATWMFLLRRFDAANVSTFQYLIPLMAVVFAYILIDEQPSLGFLIGAGLIIAGVAIANSRS